MLRRHKTAVKVTRLCRRSPSGWEWNWHPSLFWEIGGQRGNTTGMAKDNWNALSPGKGSDHFLVKQKTSDQSSTDLPANKIPLWDYWFITLFINSNLCSSSKVTLDGAKQMTKSDQRGATNSRDIFLLLLVIICLLQDLLPTGRRLKRFSVWESHPRGESEFEKPRRRRSCWCGPTSHLPSRHPSKDISLSPSETHSSYQTIIRKFFS